MRIRKTDVIVWSFTDELRIDIPKGSSMRTLSDGTLCITVPTPKGESSLSSLVDCIGTPLIRELKLIKEKV
jgi:hypothetical protein